MTDWTSLRISAGEIGSSLEWGAKKINETQVQICVWRQGASSCSLCLYVGGKTKIYPMYSAKEQGMQDVFSILLEGKELAKSLQGMSYDFIADDEHFADSYAREICGRERFGKKSGKIRGKFDFEEFDWEGEDWNTLPMDEVVMYQCHMRGFTRHSSSGVEHPGTFAGMQEKISYLKDLGVNTILCMPLYDFDECIKDSGERINYWGYGKEAYYFAPKRAYASGTQSASKEFQQLIKAFHQNGMNFYMDMYFADKSPAFIVSCLRYYALRFHVDGFRINRECMDMSWVKHDPILSHVRLLSTAWDGNDDVEGEDKRIELNDRFLIDARRFLKSDEGQTEKFYYHFREQRSGVALVHYITQHNGFTLRDLISYDIKHNEANGEGNRDGTEYNYSWNCGAEGPSRKKEVLRWRARQEKNAFVMLLLGLSTPMLLAGDEFGNSQKGNNNAYCQDNITSWLDWRLLEKNADTYKFVKSLLAFRKEQPLYHTAHTFTGVDAKGVGVPDVSCHGREPWEVHFSYYTREVGVLYFGEYFGGKTLYFAFNMHWESHEFFLPDVESGNKWRVLIDTSGEKTTSDVKKKYVMQPRSVAVFESVKQKKIKRTKKNGK